MVIKNENPNICDTGGQRVKIQLAYQDCVSVLPVHAGMLSVWLSSQADFIRWLPMMTTMITRYDWAA